MLRNGELEHLKRVPLFEALPAEKLDLLGRAALLQRVGRGATIVAEGGPADSLYVIVRGSAKVSMADEEGQEVILSILGPHEHFGEMALIDELPRSASVVALEACELIVLGKAEFQKCLAANFELASEIMRGLVRRLREADRRIESLALVNVHGRVAQALVAVADTVEGARVVGSKLTRQDIARMVGASREMVSRVLHDLAGEGYIGFDGRKILLRDKLLAYAAEAGHPRTVK